MARFLKFIFATPTVKRDRLHLRTWFVLFCVYLSVIAAVSLWGLGRYSQSGSSTYHMVWLLGLYLFYFSLACTFMPFPTSWFILFLASPVGGLALAPVPRLAVVAALGAVGTGISHINEYHVISFLLRIGRLHRIKEARIYLWAEGIFKSSPFMLQMAFNMVPIPADPARWLAIMYGYPLGKFFLAHCLGRFIRYVVMGAAAEVLALTLFQIAMIQIALLVIPVARILWPRIRSARQAPASPEEQDI